MRTKQNEILNQPNHAMNRENQMIEQTNSAKQAGKNLRHFVVKMLFVAVIMIGLFGLMALKAAPMIHAPTTILKPGCILYTDSGNAIVGGAVIMLDPVSDVRTIIASGLDLPLYLAIDSNGHLIVSAAGRLVQIDLEKAEVHILADTLPPFTGYACGVVADRRGNIVCADLVGVVTVDPSTLALGDILGCSDLPNAIGVAVAENGDLIVVMHGEV